MTIVEPAPAKINLALHVRRRRADGYHEIETRFAFLRDGDVVRVAPAKSGSFAVTGPFAQDLHPPASAFASSRGPLLRSPDASGKGKGDDANLVVRAARAFAENFAIDQAHAIVLEKNLPVASGIGGGSADAAATLRALGRLHGISVPRMAELALALGSDVPACLAGRSAFGSGRGEALRPAPATTGTPVLLVNPGVALSTATVFADWDGVDRGPLDDAAVGRNDLEAPARAIVPAIGEVLDRLSVQRGVTLARMSGSGATCFAVFDDAAARTAAHAAITRERPGWWYLASTLA